MKKSLFILPLAFMMVLSACGGGEGEDTSGTGGDPTTSATTSGAGPTTSIPTSGSTSSSSTVVPKVLSVSLNKTTLAMDLNDDTETFQLVASVQAVGGASTAVTYQSNNANVSVDASGLLTAASVGQSVITVTSSFDPTKFATCTVTVTDNYPAKDHVAKATIGGTITTLSPTKIVPEGAGGKYQYEAVVSVTSDQDIAFEFDNAPVEAGAGSFYGNNVKGTFPNYRVCSTAADIKVYFKVYETAGVVSYSFWLEGFHKDWYMKSESNGWSEANPLTHVDPDLNPYPEHCVDQYVYEANFAKDDQLKFQRNYDGQWVGYDSIDHSHFDSNVIYRGADEHNDNLIINVEGHYKFYLKEMDDASYQIYISEFPAYLHAWYSGEVTVGNTLNLGSLGARSHIDGVENDVKMSCTYYIVEAEQPDVEFNPSTYIFGQSGTYTVRADYTIPTTTTLISDEFTITVKNPVGFGIKYSNSLTTLFAFSKQKEEYDVMYDEYKSNPIHFEEDQVFSAYDNYNEVTFNAVLQNESFSAYLTQDGDNFTVESDFYAVVYLKLNGEHGNKIYFETDIVAKAEVKVGTADYALMEEDYSSTELDIVQQFKYHVDATHDAEILFKVNDSPVVVSSDKLSGNLKYDSGVKFVYDLEGCDIYFKFYGGSDYRAHATYDENFYLAGLAGWPGKVNENKMNVQEDPSLREQYSIIKELEVGNKFKIYSERPAYIGTSGYVAGFSDVEDGGAKAKFAADGDNNIVCSVAGTYKIHFKIPNEGPSKIYIMEIVAPANSLQVSYASDYVLKDCSLNLSKFTATYYDEGYYDHDVKDDVEFFIGDDEFIPGEDIFGEVVNDLEITVKYEYDTDLFVVKTFTIDVIQKVLCAYVTGTNLENEDNNAHPNYYMWVWNSVECIGHLEQVAGSEISYTDGGYKIVLAHPVASNIDRCIVFRCSPDAEFPNPDVYPADQDPDHIWNTAYVNDDDHTQHDMVVYENPARHFYADAKFWA